MNESEVKLRQLRLQEQADMLLLNKARNREKVVISHRHLYIFRWGCGHIDSIVTDEPMDRVEEEHSRFEKHCPTCLYNDYASFEARQERLRQQIAAKERAEKLAKLEADRAKRRAYMADYNARMRDRQLPQS